ncbi:hypothetical protein NDU88_004169 [Pleurodeles waltl]|uniref:Uncharacterized protein n=1 Tax=Pleurodeles waltl TaxID=8319 RepID=A0AAV7W895_PLEWA|nr:hypothetical protein NDU88_004169 [Pleurodeles waltl]
MRCERRPGLVVLLTRELHKNCDGRPGGTSAGQKGRRPGIKIAEAREKNGLWGDHQRSVRPAVGLPRPEKNTAPD